MAENDELLDQAELFTAALKIICHREKRAPSVVQIGSEIGIKKEPAHYIANRLAEVGAIRIVPAPFDERVYLEDWAKVADLAEREAAPKVDELHEQQQEERDQKAKDIESRFDPNVRAASKKDLFASLQAQLKDPTAGKKPNPLDALKKKDDEKEDEDAPEEG